MRPVLDQSGHTVEIVVPDTDKGEDDGQIVFKLGRCKVLVHGVSTVEHLLEVVEADGQTDGKTDCGPERVSSSNPIPESKHVGLVDTEFGDGIGVGGESDKVLGDVCGLSVSEIFL